MSIHNNNAPYSHAAFGWNTKAVEKGAIEKRSPEGISVSTQQTGANPLRANTGLGAETTHTKIQHLNPTQYINQPSEVKARKTFTAFKIMGYIPGLNLISAIFSFCMAAKKQDGSIPTHKHHKAFWALRGVLTLFFSPLMLFVDAGQHIAHSKQIKKADTD